MMTAHQFFGSLRPRLRALCAGYAQELVEKNHVHAIIGPLAGGEHVLAQVDLVDLAPDPGGGLAQQPGGSAVLAAPLRRAR